MKSAFKSNNSFALRPFCKTKFQSRFVRLGARGTQKHFFQKISGSDFRQASAQLGRPVARPVVIQKLGQTGRHLVQHRVVNSFRPVSEIAYPDAGSEIQIPFAVNALNFYTPSLHGHERRTDCGPRGIFKSIPQNKFGFRPCQFNKPFFMLFHFLTSQPSF